MQFDGLNILIYSIYAGYVNGVENYMWQMSELLRAEGAIVTGCFHKKARDFERFATHFDNVIISDTLPEEDYSLACGFKIPNVGKARYFLKTFKEKSTIFILDHNCYCPRETKTFPITDKNCQNSFNRWLCTLCSLPKFPISHFPQNLKSCLYTFPCKLDLYKRFPHVVVSSEFMRDNLINNDFSIESMYVIPPSIPLPARIPKRKYKEKPTILFAGNLHETKGCDAFLEALSLLHSPYNAVILGDGVESEKLKDKASKLGISDKVTFTGWVKYPQKYYEEADIALLPYKWQEPFGLVAAECAAYSLPVVTFNIGALPELIEDGINGFAVPYGDIALLAEKTELLLNDGLLRLTMGSDAYETVKNNLSEDVFLKQFEKLFH